MEWKEQFSKEETDARKVKKKQANKQHLPSLSLNLSHFWKLSQLLECTVQTLWNLAPLASVISCHPHWEVADGWELDPRIQFRICTQATEVSQIGANFSQLNPSLSRGAFGKKHSPSGQCFQFLSRFFTDVLLEVSQPGVRGLHTVFVCWFWKAKIVYLSKVT